MTIPSHTAAGRGTRRVALATCREFAGLDADDRPLVGLLGQHGITAEPAVWDSPDVDWSAFDLVVLRSTWDYPAKIDAFLAWLGGLSRALNPAPVVRWNTDKRYLHDLAASGLPVVPTSISAPGEPFAVPAGPFVVKPAIGAGSKDAARYHPGQAGEARAHVERLHRAGRAVLVQPYLARVERDCEIDVVFLGGRYSHAVRKGPMLGAARKEGPLFFEEDLRPHEATPAERELAERVMSAVPGGGDRLLYGRVDLLPADGGGAVVTELELIEPSLFFGHRPGSAGRLAELIAQAVAAANPPAPTA